MANCKGSIKSIDDGCTWWNIAQNVEEHVTEIDGIESIHHVHFWKVNEKDIHFEAHVKVNDMTVSATEDLISKVEIILHDEFEIGHVTLQFECDRCEVDNLVWNFSE